MSARIPEPVTCLSPEPGSSVSLGWTPSGANWVNDRAPTPGGPGRLWLRPSTGAATPRNVTSVTRRPASSSSALVGVSVLPARPKTILPVWPGDATRLDAAGLHPGAEPHSICCLGPPTHPPQFHVSSDTESSTFQPGGKSLSPGDRSEYL